FETLLDMLLPYGWFFWAFCFIFSYHSYRAFTRFGTLFGGGWGLRAASYVALRSTWSVLLFYLTLSSYALVVYPFIPESKGGGDYSSAKLVVVKSKSGHDLTNVILFHSNDNFFYFAKISGDNNPCKWRKRVADPVLVQVNQDEIESITPSGGSD